MTTLITGAGLIGASFARHAAERDEPVIFLHTGGVPALFAFDEEHLHG